jgi:hypothetical protein
MTRPTEAYISSNLFEAGLGYVAVARFRGSGDAEIGVFLLDTMCLGVKDAFFTRASGSEYDRSILERIVPAANRQPLDPPSARKLVEGAVAYAQSLGLAPHPDYKQGCRVFGGINPADSTATFAFGRNGKPFYVQGPHDSFAKCQRILNQLRARCGNDGFDFLVLANDAQNQELERAGYTIRQKVPVPPSQME